MALDEKRGKTDNCGKKVSNFFSFVILLFLAPIFGWYEKNAAMGLIIVAGALGITFSNLDKFSSFKGAGFEAQMHDVQKTVDALVEEQAEPDLEASRKSHDIGFLTSLTEMEVNLLKLMDHDTYRWRHQNTLIKKIGFDAHVVLNGLGVLMDLELVQSVARKRTTMYGLTGIGRMALKEIKTHPVKK